MLNISPTVLIYILMVQSYFFAYPVSAKLNNVILERITVEDGLSQATVMALAQDKQGYIWFGTENGINIYDGYKISSLAGPERNFHKFSVNNIYVASDGVVWISLFGKGLYTYNPVTNEYRLIVKSDPNDGELDIWQVIEDKKNNSFWFITEKSAMHYDVASNAIIKRIDFQEYFSSIDILYRVHILNDKLFFSSRAGLFFYNQQLNQLIKLPEIVHSDTAGFSFNEVEAGKFYALTYINKRYYVGTNDGVFSFSEHNLLSFLQDQTTSIAYQVAVENASVYQLTAIDDLVYVASTHGLYRFNSTSEKSEFLFKFGQHFPSVADANIISLLTDHNGQLWMGSQSSGAYRWDPKTEIITTYTYHHLGSNSLSSANVTSIVPTQNKQLWVATDDGLNLVDLETNSIKRFLENSTKKTSFTQSNIYEIAQDYLGRLWLSTAVGILLFDSNEQKLMPTNFPQETLDLLAAKDWVSIESIGQHIWIVSAVGIHKIHAKTGELVYFDDLPDYFDAKYIWHIMASFSGDPNEVLFSGTDILWQYNQLTKQLTQIYRHKGLAREGYSYIDNWVRDSQGLIWLSYSQVGLLALSPDDYKVQYFFDEHNSPLDANLYGVQVDRADNIWVSSHSGLFRLRVADKHIRRFNKLDGLASSEFNAGAFAALDDGRLLYGGISGVNVFDPIELDNKNQHSSNTVSIVNIDTLSRPLNSPHIISNDYQVALAHDDFGIRIDFSDFSYGYTENPIFKYGFVNGVSFPETQQNFVTFPRLDSGEYIFQVQAKSAITGEYSRPAFIRINVNYAPWRSPFAYSCYVLAVMIAIALWLRSRQLRRNELVKAHNEVKFRENRLQLALSASNSDVWDWQAHNDVIFAKRFVKELGYQNKDTALHFSHHVALIHAEDRDDFLLKWQEFLMSANADALFECTYRLKCADDEWMWYRDVGKIVTFDPVGQPSRVTGSYSNITESKAVQERAQYYGAAFEQTRDWVLIFDENFEIGRANKAMSDAFGWTTEELKLSHGLPGITPKQINAYRKLLPSINTIGYWRGEEFIETPDGKEYHVITNISISKNIEHKKSHYILVYTDITALKSAENELRIMANYDHLTGLPNRSLLLDRIEHAMAASKRKNEAIALFFIDLDRFKQVNDSLGHEYGDRLLKEVSKRLGKSLRADDTLSRIGGDEFVVLLERFRDPQELGRIAQRFIELVQKPFTLNNNVVSIGASIGISLYPDDADDSAEFFRNADVAMYHAKQLGRNNYQFFTEHMNLEAKLRLTKETNLKLGFGNDEFFNVYQPIIDAYEGRAVGAELLMRWHHNGVVVPPIEFITLAEELGLIIPMTEQAMKRGFKQLQLWRQQRPDFYLSVNFSAKHFSDKNLISSIEALLAQFDLPANALKIEITESAFIFEPEKAINTMNTLSDMGVLLSLDDFGTGFSSLTYLKQLPLDIIKIDRSFVAGIGVEKTDEAIIEATLVLAKSLNIYCIAEGVETKAQLNYLVERQCHYIQGYLYSKPLEALEFIENLKKGFVEIKAVTQGSDATHG